MNQTEQVLYSLPLPSFVNKFKDSCLSQLLPIIDKTISAIDNAGDPIIILLFIILFIQLIRLAILQAQTQKKEVQASSSSETHLISKEIKDLKKEIKAVHKSIEQLKSQGLSIKGSTAKDNQKPSSIQTEKIVQYCRASWNQRESMAEKIIDYQIKLIEEVKKIKAKSRISSPSKIQSSSSKQSVKKSKIPQNKQNMSNSSLIMPPAASHLQSTKNERKQYESEIIQKTEIKFEQPKNLSLPTEQISAQSLEVNKMEVSAPTFQQEQKIANFPKEEAFSQPPLLTSEQVEQRQQEQANAAFQEENFGKNQELNEQKKQYKETTSQIIKQSPPLPPPVNKSLIGKPARLGTTSKRAPPPPPVKRV